MALMGSAMPTQMGMFQDGNVSAQMQLLAGLPQYQNAILGAPVNYGALQPTRLAMPDSSFYSQRLPDFGMAQAPAPGQGWGQQPQMQNQQVGPQIPLGGAGGGYNTGQLLGMLLGGFNGR